MLVVDRRAKAFEFVTVSTEQIEGIQHVDRCQSQREGNVRRQGLAQVVGLQGPVVMPTVFTDPFASTCEYFVAP